MAQNQNEMMEQIEDFDEDCVIEEEDTQVTKIEDVVKANALRFLLAKILARLRAVSPEWNTWIQSPIFAHHQSYYFQKLSGFFCQYDNGDHTFMTLDNEAYGVPDSSLGFLPDLVNIRSSSGGLLLCQGRNNNSYYICNPFTQNWNELPEPKYYHDIETTAVVLAFEPSLLNIQAHYQVICAFPLLGQPNIVRFEVYSSETGCWTQSCEDYVDSDYTRFRGNGFHMNGNVYWETTEGKVLAFGVTADTHEIIFLPSESPQGGVLTQMHGEVCYVSISKNFSKEYSIEIQGGMRLKSKGVFDIIVNIDSSDEICEASSCRVLQLLEGCVVMILVGNSIFTYNLKDRSTELLMREGLGPSRVAVTYLPYVNTLVYVS